MAYYELNNRGNPNKATRYDFDALAFSAGLENAHNASSFTLRSMPRNDNALKLVPGVAFSA